MTSFKEKFSFEERKAESDRIRAKYPDRIPVIAETSQIRKYLTYSEKLPTDYIAIGSLFETNSKKDTIPSSLDVITNLKKTNFKKEIVAIGGINNKNYRKLIRAGAKYIAISSFIWDNPKLKPELAIRKFK